MNKELLIYQGKNGEILLKEDGNNETIWANLDQIAEIFWRNKSTISRHIRNIFDTDELVSEQAVAKYATVQTEGTKQVKRNIEYYNLDMIISVGYRVNSKEATQFRIWATKTLKEHITKGYTINPKRIQWNYDNFLKAVEEVRKLIPGSSENIKTDDILELIKHFASTWFSLESYDEDTLPAEGFTKSTLELNASELYKDVGNFKSELMSQGQATDLFAREKRAKSLEWIFWNIFQTYGWADVYPSLEEKAAHFLYFVVKNHPFIDGNKRTGAFCFLWFLSKVGYRFESTITPQALTAITLLVAESNPKDKLRIVGLIILLLKK